MNTDTLEVVVRHEGGEPAPCQARMNGNRRRANRVGNIRAYGWIKPLHNAQQDVNSSGHLFQKALLTFKWEVAPAELHIIASASEERSHER